MNEVVNAFCQESRHDPVWLASPKISKLVKAFNGPNAAILVYLPGFLGLRYAIPPAFSTGLQVAQRPLKITTNKGGALFGMGFSSDSTGPVQIFHVDYIYPGEEELAHVGSSNDDVDAWSDGRFNYQIPRQ